MAPTLIFIHKGDSWYLVYTLWQARKTNPKSRIILLGTWETTYYPWLLGIEHYPIQSYSNLANQGLAQYIHLSTNGEEFEWFCLARWFILYEFLTRNPEMTQCIYLDSDILVYDSLAQPTQDLWKFGMTMVGYSAHTNFVNDVAFLGQFCAFVSSHYTEDKLRDWLQTHYANFLKKAGAGGISDMTFLHKFRSQNLDRMGTLLDPMGDKDSLYAFDETLDSDAGGYEVMSHCKILHWINHIPYCKHIETDTLVKFYTLHFQGQSKSKLKAHIPLKHSLNLFFITQLHSFIYFFLRVSNKVSFCNLAIRKLWV